MTAIRFGFAEGSNILAPLSTILSVRHHNWGPAIGDHVGSADEFNDDRVAAHEANLPIVQHRCLVNFTADAEGDCNQYCRDDVSG